MRNDSKRWWSPISDFAHHIAIGTAIFIIVGAPAIGLSFLVHYLETLGVGSFTVTVLTFLEHAILIVDSALFLVYLGSTAYKAVKGYLK
jgi:hypothetical protein